TRVGASGARASWLAVIPLPRAFRRSSRAVEFAAIGRLRSRAARRERTGMNVALRDCDALAQRLLVNAELDGAFHGTLQGSVVIRVGIRLREQRPTIRVVRLRREPGFETPDQRLNRRDLAAFAGFRARGSGL